ncbi:MAG: glycosyltransferase family 2 protein [Candidatus Sumerlaeia bacterium]|nr:glycosyltransferase family 2 protein [Candidatus Sumerlaeia bacterium]
MQIKSLTIFFPCYNDSATIAGMVILAHEVARDITDDFEVIVIDDGSSDSSRLILEELKEQYPETLKLIFHQRNKGYGGALRSGFANATKEWIFYTDGDAQYDVRELTKLVEKVSDEIDVVQGYKIKRHDPWHRIVIGLIYQYGMKILFGLKIKDVDCDFRLLRRRIFDKVKLNYNTGIICLELIKKIQHCGFRFAEVGVNHYFRLAGKSQFFNFRRVMQVGLGIFKLWFELIILKRY